MKDCQILVKTYFVTGMTRRFVSAKRLLRSFAELIIGPHEISRHIRHEVFYDKYSIIRLCMNCNS